MHSFTTCALDIHSRRAALVMARGAISEESTVGRDSWQCRARVGLVREPKVAGGQPGGSRLPRDALLDDAIVTRGAG